MLSRALSLATVTLLIGCLTAGVARAVENLDAGKSPSQIFSNTCSACHKSPRGLLKSVSASSLPGFLRQHYTTGTDMASQLSSFLISNGAADPRYQSKDQSKQKNAKQDGKTGSARPARSPAATGRTCAGGCPAGRRRSTTARRGRASGPRREATRAPRGARCRQTCGWAGPGAGRDRQQIGRQAEAGQTWQARNRRTAENRAASPWRCRERRCVAGCRQG